MNSGQSQKPIYVFENMLKLFSLLLIVTGLISMIYIKALLISVQVLCIYRQYGMIQFNQQYLVKLVESEFIANILYVLATFQQNSYVYYFPLSIQLFTGKVQSMIVSRYFGVHDQNGTNSRNNQLDEDGLDQIAIELKESVYHNKK